MHAEHEPNAPKLGMQQQVIHQLLIFLLNAVVANLPAQGMAQVHGTTLDKLVVVHRHGSRSKLAKDHKTLAEGGATLTLLGQQQMHQVLHMTSKRLGKGSCPYHLCFSSLPRKTPVCPSCNCKGVGCAS